MGLASWLNTAWMLKCTGEVWAFRRATRRAAQTQADVLRQIISKNRHTEFGITHGFDSLTNPGDYQNRVPLSTYEIYAAQIDRIAAGESNVLTAERVELLEPTSGTTDGEKLIPYTASLRRQFQRAVAAWVGDLFWHRPAVRSGRAYWSISPAFGAARRSAGGIPIGFDDDAAYLGTLERFALDKLLVVPPAVARIPDIETFRYCTLLCMLRAEDLSLISVWNPTFLSALLAPLTEWQDRLCFDLRRGTFNPPTPMSAALAAQLSRRLRADARRADRLESILRCEDSLAEKLRQVWPQLALISCWADAAAERYLNDVRELFPSVEVQPKGLLATEGCVSFPLTGRPAAALALRSHFFEFEECDGAGDDRPNPTECRLAHELDRGGRYRVVITTGGGLYRYRLRDEVQVVGFESECPLLRFLGRSDLVSDLVGEKLSEPHVRHVLDGLFTAYDLAPRFAMLVPVEGRPAHYHLYLQGPDVYQVGPILSDLTAALQAGLEENPHYRYAVRLRQLDPVEIHILDSSGGPGWLVVERRCAADGQKPGSVKPTALDTRIGWPEQFNSLANHPAGSL